MKFPNLSVLLRAQNGLGYLIIISIQFGVQPLLVKQFIDKQCVTSSVVLSAELAKIVGCLFIMFSDDTAERCFRNWKLQDCLLAAGIPSVTYLIQNFCVQVAYQNLDGVVFNVLNQCLHSPLSSSEEWALQKRGRNSFLLSLELATMGCLILVTTLLLGLSPDSVRMKEFGFFAGWRATTVIPVLTQGLAGIIVGIVTQVAGGVRKVMATICGLILTCLLQQVLLGLQLSWLVLAAVPLVAGGIYLHETLINEGMKELCFFGSGGEWLSATDTLPPPPTTPRGRSSGLELLARPKSPNDALGFLRALAKRFSKDPILRRMLKQCLDGARKKGRGDADLLLETKVLKQACPDKTPRAAEGLLDGRLKLRDPPGQNEGSFQLWLDADSDRASRFVNLLQNAGQVTRRMKKLMERRAQECLKRGARLCSTGPVVPARSRTDSDLPAFYVVEDRPETIPE
eukprot:g18255.t1